MLSPRSGPCEGVSSVTVVDADVRRTDLVPSTQTGGITVQATDPRAPRHAAGRAGRRRVARRRPRRPARSSCSGSVAAERLGITDVADGVQVWLGDQWFTVIGILEPVELAEDLDRTALIGEGIAADAVRHHREPRHDLPAGRPRPDRRRCAPCCPPPPTRESPDTVEVGPAHRRHRGQGRGQQRLHRAVPRARRRRPARRRRRHRQRDGDLRARAALRDRPAPSPRRHPPPRQRPVPRRGPAAVRPRRRHRRPARRRRDRRRTTSPAAGRWSCPWSASSAAWSPPCSSAPSPASTRPPAPPASPRPTP